MHGYAWSGGGRDIIRVDVPDTIDLTTGKITCRQKKVHRFIIKFRGSELRRG